MSDESLTQEAEFLKVVAPLPVLSNGLRSRVLAAALEARERRSQGRRVVSSALSVFALLGWIAWKGPFSAARTALAATSTFNPDGTAAEDATEGSPAASSTYCRRDMLNAAMGDDWRMVEAELQSREDFTRRVQM
jgi:hypothetical protein